MIQPSALCNSDPGGCDISSDRKRGAILFLFIIPVTWIAE